jgi:HD-GYP domain-containing protein (c-di-GMP phosphodiesterase class II)
MTDDTLTSVNEHLLDNVMKLTTSTDVTALEDIYDAHGTKLLAKGAVITPALKDRILRHKLRKPLEASLLVADGVTSASVQAKAEHLLGAVPALKVFMGGKQAYIFETLAKVSFHPPAALLVSVADKGREGLFQHGILVALIAISLGAHQKLERDTLVMLALAGLLHDIGELYIDPNYIHTQRALKPEEWKLVAAHPLIGRIVLSELTNYPAIILDAVACHHERLDGSGYPRQLSGKQVSPLAQILSMAETLSGIIVSKNDALVRSCLALKCIPGEHSRDLISVVSALRRNYAGNAFPAGIAATQTTPDIQGAHGVAKTLVSAVAECEAIAQIPSLPPTELSLLHHVENRLAGLRQALKATGIVECIDENGHMVGFTQKDHEIFLEIEVVGQEIGWRLRDIARDLYLRLSDNVPETVQKFSRLIEILDNPVTIDPA